MPARSSYTWLGVLLWSLTSGRAAEDNSQPRLHPHKTHQLLQRLLQSNPLRTVSIFSVIKSFLFISEYAHDPALKVDVLISS